MPHDSTLGAVLVGGFVASVFYGVMSLQAYTFFQRYPREGPALKYTIYVLWVLHTLHFVFIAYGIYTFLVTNFGNIASTQIDPWSIGAASLINAVMAMVVHCAYCHRVWELSDQNRFLTIVPLLLAFVTLVFGIASDIKLLIFPTFAAYRSTEWLLFVALLGACVTDLYIAIWLCWWLKRQSKGLSNQTRSMVNTIVVYIVATGMLISVLAIVELIMGAALPNTYIFIAIDFFRTGMYTNSLMASLNARERFRKNLEPHTPVITSVRFARGTAVQSDAIASVSSGTADVEQAGLPGAFLEKVDI